MNANDLFNTKKEEFENTETFAERLYKTAKRVNRSLILDPSESQKVIFLLSRYYGENTQDILSVIRNCTSGKYRIQWVKCLGDHYLTIELR